MTSSPGPSALRFGPVTKSSKGTVAVAIRAGHLDHRVERGQHRQGVAGGRGRAQVAADRAGVADLRRSDGAGGLGQGGHQPGQVGPQHLGVGHAGAQPQVAVDLPPPLQRGDGPQRRPPPSAAGIRLLTSTMKSVPPASGWASGSDSAATASSIEVGSRTVIGRPAYGCVLGCGMAANAHPQRHRAADDRDTATSLDPGSVLIDGTDIVAVGTGRPTSTATPWPPGADVVDATGHAVIPGLHNCHLHSGLLRGTAESLSLWDWLKTYVDPAHRALTPEIAAAASRHCYAESVLAGTTSVMDMWRFMEGSAAAADQIGIRATLVPYVADAEGYDYFESIDSNRRLLTSHRTACRRAGAGVGRPRAPLLLHAGGVPGRGRRWPTSSTPGSTPTRRRRSGRSRSRSSGSAAGPSRCCSTGACSRSAPSSPTACGSTTARSPCWPRPAPPSPTARAPT